MLLLDEPLSALDPFLRVRMRVELKRLQTQLGIPFIHVTHGQDEALALADLVVVMNKGKIEQAGTPREVFEKPATEFVARFLGGHNVIAHARRPDRGARRPHAARAATASNATRWPATVTGVEYQGASYHGRRSRAAARAISRRSSATPISQGAGRRRRSRRPRLERGGHSSAFPCVLSGAGF